MVVRSFARSAVLVPMTVAAYGAVMIGLAWVDHRQIRLLGAPPVWAGAESTARIAARRPRSNAIIHLVFDRMRRHFEGLNLFGFELDIAID